MNNILNELEIIAAAVDTQMPPPDLQASMLERINQQLDLQSDLFIVKAKQGEWFDYLPGIKVKILCQEGEVVTSIWKLQPGTEFPEHGHDENEECLVLEGGFTIAGVELEEGDFLLGEKGKEHPVAFSNEGATLFIRGKYEGLAVAA
ncbi:MAG: cupin domain-containing protein [bacterium]